MRSTGAPGALYVHEPTDSSIDPGQPLVHGLSYVTRAAAASLRLQAFVKILAFLRWAAWGLTGSFSDVTGRLARRTASQSGRLTCFQNLGHGAHAVTRGPHLRHGPQTPAVA